MLKIKILSRRDVEHTSIEEAKNDNWLGIISVNDASPPADLEKKCKAKPLVLYFADIDSRTDSQAGFLTLFTENDAFKILRYVDELLHKIKYPEEDWILVVHCLAGVCRSAAIAAAISKILYNEDDLIFKTKSPNMLVYTTLLNVYFTASSKEIQQSWPTILAYRLAHNNDVF